MAVERGVLVHETLNSSDPSGIDVLSDIVKKQVVRSAGIFGALALKKPAGRDTGNRGRARRERDRTVLEQLRSKLVFRNSFDAVWRVSQNRHAPTHRRSGCTPGRGPVRV